MAGNTDYMSKVFPTYVGMIRLDRLHPGREACVPHVCGDDPEYFNSKRKAEAVFPTYVGMIR